MHDLPKHSSQVDALDIDKLHNVVEMRNQYEYLISRGIGKTTSRIYDVIGNTYCNKKTIVCLISFYTDMNYINNLFTLECLRCSLTYSYNPTKQMSYITCKETGVMSKVYFITENLFDEKTRSLYDYCLIPMRHED